jgi:hypothetical protein
MQQNIYSYIRVNNESIFLKEIGGARPLLDVYIILKRGPGKTQDRKRKKVRRNYKSLKRNTKVGKTRYNQAKK